MFASPRWVRTLIKRVVPKVRRGQDRLLEALAPAERKPFMEMLVRVIDQNEALARPEQDERGGRRRSSSGELDETPGRESLAFVLLLSVALLSLTTERPRAQQWPRQQVRLIVPFPAGAGNDVAARIIAEGLSRRWGKPVIIENKPGGDTTIGAAAFSHRATNTRFCTRCSGPCRPSR